MEALIYYEELAHVIMSLRNLMISMDFLDPEYLGAGMELGQANKTGIVHTR